MSRSRIKRGCALLAVAVAALALAACGGAGDTSGQARTVLRQAFEGRSINSGDLTVSLAVVPSGSQTLKSPIELNFGGPFQAASKGEAPKSNFTLRLSALGRSATFGVISTGTRGYVTLQGTAYQLPQATFRKFESGLAPVTRPGSSAKLPKVKLLSWVRNPVVVGNETVGGANTKHVHAGVDVRKMLTDLSSVIQQAPSAGASGLGSSISGATVTRIARKVRHPTLDVWSGARDHIIRKLALNFGVPVSGSISTLFGGLRSAHVSLVVQYAHINQPQTITAPSSAQPFSGFLSKVRGLLQGLQGGSAGILGPGGSSGGAASSQKLQRYTQCIQSAGRDVAKMQRCAAILNK